MGRPISTAATLVGQCLAAAAAALPPPHPSEQVTPGGLDIPVLAGGANHNIEEHAGLRFH